MSQSLWCLLGYAAWTMLLVAGLAVYRFRWMARGEMKANEFSAPHGTPAYRRLQRAHANACENLPIFGSVVLIGTIARVDSALFAWLPVLVLSARVVQSVAHISSETLRAANVRLSAFFVQQLGTLGMIIEIVRTHL